jgi:hypothetical protein
MASDQEDPRSHRILAIASVAALAGAGAFAFGRVFRGAEPTLKLLAAALLSMIVAHVLHRRGPLVAVIGSSIGFFVTASVLVFPNTVLGIFPTGDTIGAIGRALDHVGRQARVEVAPSPPLRPLLLAAVTAVWTASFAAHSLAIRSGSPLLAALPPASLLVFAEILLRDGPRPGYAILFLCGVLAVMFVDGLRRVRQWGPFVRGEGRDRSRLGSATATRGARRVTFAVLGVALLIPGLLPGFGAGPLVDVDPKGVAVSPEVNPLVSVTASLKGGNPVEVFKVRAESPAYWRWMSLEDFDGTTWTSSDLSVRGGQEVGSGAPLPQPVTILGSPEVTARYLDQEITLVSPPGQWLPMAYAPLSIQLGADRVRYDPERAVAVPDGGVSPGMTYSVTSRLVVPTARELDRDTALTQPAFARYTELPLSTPPEIYRIAHDLTDDQPTPFRKLLAIQNYLQTFTYDQSVSGAHDIHTVLNFLTHTHRGFCQQFATAMAVLARALGYPARVAVGFTPGVFDRSTGLWRVDSDNAHSWVEVLFPGYGWQAFEPTPTRDNPVADQYLSPRATSYLGCIQVSCPDRQGGTNANGQQPAVLRPRILGLDSRLEQHRRSGATGSRETTGDRDSWFPYGWVVIVLISSIGALAIGIPIGKALVRRGLMLAAGEPREAILAAYRVFSGRAADAGYERWPGETLLEYRARLLRDVHFSNGHLEQLTALVGVAAYSPAEVTENQAETAKEAAREAIRDVRRSAPVYRRIAGVFRPAL